MLRGNYGTPLGPIKLEDFNDLIMEHSFFIDHTQVVHGAEFVEAKALACNVSVDRCNFV